MLGSNSNEIHYLEDGLPGRTDMWLITMVRFRPLRMGLWDPFQMAFLWLINGGDPNYLLSGMILQLPCDLEDSDQWMFQVLAKGGR